MTLTVGSLFSGVGGIDLGLQRAGFDIRWQVEIDEWCRRVLTKHWPDVPKYGDITELRGDELEHVDLIAGGFPCQDVSQAGLRAGIDGERSGLWREFARMVGVLRPRYVLVENTPGLLARGMGRVLGDLAALGYDAEWSVVSACAMGAPHTRERVFILAYPDRVRCDRRTRNVRPAGRAESPNGGEWGREPGVCRVAPRLPSRVDRVRGLGNAVVPQVAQWVGERIMAMEAA